MVVIYLVAAKVSFRGWDHVTAAGVPMLFAALLGLALQTAFEELYFRGLIAQATRRLIQWLPVVIGVQAVYFASLHVGNVEAWGSGNLAMVPYLVPAVPRCRARGKPRQAAPSSRQVAQSRLSRFGVPPCRV
jgi:membrane protease YdiL (CAAX protease family)